MSRTYRRDFISLDVNNKPSNGRYFDDGREYWEQGHCDYYSKRNCKRDRKSFMKSPSSFKKVMKKRRKAKERNAMQRKDYENVPIFHKENDWLYN